MKTAVEFLQESLSIHFSFEQKMQFEGLFQQAKEMEKEQIEKSFDEGWLQCNINELPEKSRKHFKTASDYFDFTYTQSSE